jgi:hypothetical protein
VSSSEFTFTFIVTIIISVFVPGRSHVVQKLKENSEEDTFTEICCNSTTDFRECVVSEFTFTVTCGTNPLFQFLYRPGTKTEIIIVTINVKVNSEEDTFSVLGCTAK